MFSVAHLVIIFVVALIVFGPEKLPDLARNLGKVMGEFRRATGDLRSTFESHMRDLEREAELRKAREAAAAVPSPSLPERGATGVAEENATGETLPLSTPEATETVDPAEVMKDSPPPTRTVESDRPNAAAFTEPAALLPQQIEFETPSVSPIEQPDSDSRSEKASNGRSRPA
jgi:TatA/E family protein of Tat protein translocase